MELGHYFTLKNPEDRVTTQTLPFFLDIYMSFAHVTLLRNKIDPYKSYATANPYLLRIC